MDDGSNVEGIRWPDHGRSDASDVAEMLVLRPAIFGGHAGPEPPKAFHYIVSNLPKARIVA